MGKFAKWIGLGVGFAFFGPIGALFGFLGGAVADNASKYSDEYMKDHPYEPNVSSNGDFISSLLVLCAAIMKADGKVMRSELDYVRTFLRNSFGPEAAQEGVHMLQGILKQDIPLNDVCFQIRGMDYQSKVQLLHFLYGISLSDGHAHDNEIKTIEQIADMIGISYADSKSIKAMFIRDNGYAYDILEVDRSASNDEIKKAYRKMAVKFHPDKVAHLSEDVQNKAKEKFQEVNNAYDKIKKERQFV